MATEIVQALSSADTAGTAPLSPGDIYVAAARAEHLTHCAGCREIAAASEARAAENAASIARRDRRQLDLHIASAKAVA